MAKRNATTPLPEPAPKKGRQKRSAALSALGPLPPESEFINPNPNPLADDLDRKVSPQAYSNPVTEKQPTRRVVAKSAEDAFEQIKAAIVCQVEALLDKHMPRIQQAYTAAIEDGDEDNDHKKKYTFSLAPSITGDDPTHYTVKTKIGYAVKTSDSEEDQVAVGEDLVDLMGKKDK
jgi:hypothetical protein